MIQARIELEGLVRAAGLLVELAGGGGVYRLRTTGIPVAEQVVAGGALLGLAFDRRGGLVLASTDTVYRLDVQTGQEIRRPG